MRFRMLPTPSTLSNFLVAFSVRLRDCRLQAVRGCNANGTRSSGTGNNPLAHFFAKYLPMALPDAESSQDCVPVCTKLRPRGFPEEMTRSNMQFFFMHSLVTIGRRFAVLLFWRSRPVALRDLDTIKAARLMNEVGWGPCHLNVSV